MFPRESHAQSHHHTATATEKMHGEGIGNCSEITSASQLYPIEREIALRDGNVPGDCKAKNRGGREVGGGVLFVV